MSRKRIALGLVCCLALAAGPALGQGRSGKGQSAEHRMDQTRERAEEQARERAEQDRERAEQARERTEEHAREGREEAERPEHAASSSPGFFDGVRRFFGWGRSEERRSEQGAEHEKASEQERGPKEQR